MTLESLISEPIQPLFDGEGGIAGEVGEPILPRRFTWNDRIHEIEAMLDHWKTYGPCRHGSGEQYLRRHWFKIRTTGGDTMVLYFDRQPPRRGKKMQRWWLYTITREER